MMFVGPKFWAIQQKTISFFYSLFEIAKVYFIHIEYTSATASNFCVSGCLCDSNGSYLHFSTTNTSSHLSWKHVHNI